MRWRQARALLFLTLKQRKARPKRLRPGQLPASGAAAAAAVAADHQPALCLQTTAGLCLQSFGEFCCHRPSRRGARRALGAEYAAPAFHAARQNSAASTHWLQKTRWRKEVTD
jgi:hypothetical protein